MVLELEFCAQGFVSVDHRLLTGDDLRIIGGFDSEGMKYREMVSEADRMGGDYFCKGCKTEVIVYKSRE